MLLLPWMIIAAKWAPAQRQAALLLGGFPAWKFTSWLYYIQNLPRLTTTMVIAAAAAGGILGIGLSRYRKESGIAALWFAVVYVWSSLISVKEPRYALLLIPPL